MSAPNSAYLTEKLPLQDVGVVKYDNLLALKLVEYGSNIKSLFYLDALLVAKENGGSKEGFCGLVIVGGANAAMHASARWSKGRTSPDNGATKYIILNDGGLNTLATTSGETPTSSKIFDIRATSDFNSSFYASSTQYGFRGRQRNSDDSGWESWQVFYLNPVHGAIPAKTSVNLESIGLGTDRKGMTYEVQPFITNEEGTFYGNILGITPTAQPYLFYGFTEYFYIDTPDIGVGTRLYSDINFNTYIQFGGEYWVDDRYYWIYTFDFFENGYVFTERIDSQGGGGPDPTEPSRFDYAGYSSFSQYDADNQVLGGAGQNTGTLWYSPDDNRYYQTFSGSYPNWSFSNVANDGYYAAGNVAGVTAQMQLIDGEPQ